ncbi:hypothetical protein O7627_32435 [Solwaraspora sp. WMMD1047]|uniref:hypothetical protein n=1 Tax=Solwaraspora sp. WMMD1047 TaxID=3016102 RepID=UPI00241762E6|nr:hypothetical protein [Solwaraspora sp. WMMD1047]MDG4833980.1 hypothetical protein [Solwaraspora sp. WMMD1047]
MTNGIGVAAGDVVYVGRSASVQFSGTSAFVFRVIRVDDRPTYHGWAWLEGYQLDRNGDAVDRREIFVRPAGLRRFARASASPVRTPYVRRFEDAGASLRNAPARLVGR